MRSDGGHTDTQQVCDGLVGTPLSRRIWNLTLAV